MKSATNRTCSWGGRLPGSKRKSPIVRHLSAAESQGKRSEHTGLSWNHWPFGVWLLAVDKLRDILRNSRFEQELAPILPNIHRPAQFLQAVEMLLPTPPASGTQIANSHLC